MANKLTKQEKAALTAIQEATKETVERIKQMEKLNKIVDEMMVKYTDELEYLKDK